MFNGDCLDEKSTQSVKAKGLGMECKSGSKTQYWAIHCSAVIHSDSKIVQVPMLD